LKKPLGFCFGFKNQGTKILFGVKGKGLSVREIWVYPAENFFWGGVFLLGKNLNFFLGFNHRLGVKDIPQRK